MSILGKQMPNPGDHHTSHPLAWSQWLLAVSLILLMGLMSVPAAYAAAEVGYIARIVGKVKIDNVTAKRGSAFNAGSSITTGAKSYALLKFVDGQRVFLKADSSLVVDEYTYDKETASNNASSLSLLKGGIRAVSGLIAKHNREAVRYNTPTVTMGVRGTEFMLSIVNSQLFIHVISGAIGFIPPIAGMDTLEAGEYLALSDLGDVIGTGDKARQAAEKAGAFRQMNSARMDSADSGSAFQWGGVQIAPVEDAPITPVDALDFIEDSSQLEAMEAAPIGTGDGKFERVEP